MRPRALVAVVVGVAVAAMLAFLAVRVVSRETPHTAAAGSAGADDDDSAADDRADSGDAGAVDVAASAAAGARVLFGEVVDAEGEPVGGAIVRGMMEDGSVREVRAGDDGSFTLDNLRRPLAELRFRADGFAPVRIDGAALPQMAEAFWSQRLERALTAGITRVEGVVVDERGAPLPRFRLVVRTAPTERERARGRPGRPFSDDTVEDPRGQFVREIAKAAELIVAADGYRTSAPVLVEPASASAPATERTRKVRFALERSNALHGIVRDAKTGEPIAGATIAIDREPLIEPVVSGSDGRFALKTLPPARTSIRVSADGYAEILLGGVRGDRTRNEDIVVELSAQQAGGTREFVGIGAQVGRHSEGVLIEGIYDGSAAAGVLEAGDVIVEVDGLALGGQPLAVGMSAIRGAEGTRADLVVKKRVGGTRVQVSVERKRISLPEG